MKRTVFSVAAVVLAALVVSVGGGADKVALGQASPPSPVSIVPTNGSNLGEVILSWEAVPGAAYYRVGWMAREDFNSATTAGDRWEEEFRYSNIGNRGQTSHTLTRLTPGIEYLFIVGSNHDTFDPPEDWSTWKALTLTAAPTPPPTPGPTPPPTPGIFKYQAIDAGKNHTCGVKLDNTLECWGDNTQGQTNAPAGQFLSVSAGGVYSCGIDFENQLQCWGHAAIPSAPDGDYTHVSVGDEHACAITVAVDNQNRIVCWGLPNNDGRTVNQGEQYTPWTLISVGSDYSCALYRNGISSTSDLRCWGEDSAAYENRRYSGSSWSHYNTQYLSAGGAHLCSVHKDGSAHCRGNDVHGQVSGLPSSEDEGGVEDFYTYSAVSAGGRHTCGVRTTGLIRCWGDNLRGQATPPGGNDELRAGNVGVGDFTAVSAGDAHTCGLRRDGTVVCWGLNDYNQADPS